MTLAIHVFSAPADKFFVNSFVIESEDAVVVVDSQFLVSTAHGLAELVASKNKKVAGIIVTHPHPDHFNGLPILLERFGAIPVYANQPTIDTIKATREAKRIAWTPVYGNDYPSEDALPDRVIDQDETLLIGEIEIRSSDIGPGESADNTVLYIPATQSLIASDLIYHRCHPWLAEQRTSTWLAQITRIEAMFPEVMRIYPGHGPAGGRELFEAQRSYIIEQREIVTAHARNGKLADVGLDAVRAKARAGRDGWPLDGLIDMNAAAIAAELQEIKV